MNKYSENISAWLQVDDLLTAVEEYNRTNPDSEFQINNITVSLERAVVNLEYIKGVLLESIGGGQFEKLPVWSQHEIHNHVQAVFHHKGNIHQFVQQVESLYYHVTISGIEKRLEGYDTYKTNLKNIAGLRRSYRGTLRGLENLKEQVEEIQTNHSKSEELLTHFTNVKSKLEENLKTSESDFKSFKHLLNEAKKAVQEVENSKKEVVAFKSNVDEYKSDIEKTTVKATTLTTELENNKQMVDKLISDSHKALGLKASEGMSAAISVQYQEEADIKRRRQWLVGSVMFLIIAFLGVLLLIFKFRLGEQEIVADSINAIIARVVFVAIAITGATFTSRQYLRQKRLADEYAYKLVLAKSIVAFAQEIKRHSPEKASEYLTSVLNEINKSPMASTSQENQAITKDNIDLFERLTSSSDNK